MVVNNIPAFSVMPDAASDTVFDIVYRDDHLIAIDKPPAWLVHRTPLAKGETRFVLQRLRDQIGQHLWPVHRLDRGTSGVLVFALTPEVARRVAAQFEADVGLRKTYRAMVRGWPPEQVFIDHALKRMPDDMRSERIEMQAAQSQLRTLRCGVWPIPYGDFPSLRWAEVELQPLTGRRHQLRRHCKHIAHPILGDGTHGKGPLNRAVAAHLGLHRLWLHALHLAMPHPVTGQVLSLNAPLGEDWSRWGETLTPLAAASADATAQAGDGVPPNRGA